MSIRRREVTLSSGPIHIPRTDSANDNNDRLIIIIKNNTDRTLQANAIVETSFPGDDPIVLPLPSSRNFPIVIIDSLNRTDIPAHSYQIFEIEIPFDSRPFITVVSRGDYAVSGGRPVAGGLEISIIAGAGRTTDVSVPLTGLFSSEPASFVPYGSWVVEHSRVFDS